MSSSVGEDKDGSAASLQATLCGELRDKGKQKKWRKKADKGEIRTATQYAIARLLCGLTGRALIRYIPDKTREKSEHDMHLHEVRSFIQSILMEEALPRYFQADNQGYIRYVLHIHVAECPQEAQLLQSLGEDVVGKTFKLRISKNTQNEDMECLANKLLTLPLDQCETEEILHHFYPNASAATSASSSRGSDDVEAKKPEEEPDNSSMLIADKDSESTSIFGYVKKYSLSLSLMKMWNYPLAAACFQDELQRDGDAKDEPASKRARTGHADYRSEVTGVLLGSPLQHGTLVEAAGQLQAVAACYYKDFPRNPQLQLHDLQHPHKFYETLLSTSQSYRALRDLLWREHRIVRVVALDCEMVENTAGDLVIARVSLIDADTFYCEGKEENQDVIFDVLVHPDEIVKDYRTPFSGITADLLKDVNLRLQDVQALILGLISSETILIGHSLENDLKALGIVHANCVDTSILYPHVRGYPYRQKLRHLAKDFLQLDIQNHSTKKKTTKGKAIIGHDSIEDARTALQLVLRKIEGGPLFGILAEDGSDPLHRRMPFLSRLSHFNAKSCYGKGKVRSLLLHQKDEGGLYNIDSCVASGDAETSTSLSSQSQSFQSHPDLQHLLNAATAFIFDNGSKPADISNNDNKTVGDVVKGSLAPIRFVSLVITDKGVNTQTIVETLTNLRTYASADKATIKESGALVITTQPSLQKVHDLIEKRRLCMNLGSKASMCTSLWSSEQEMALKHALKTSLMGHVSFSTL